VEVPISGAVGRSPGTARLVSSARHRGPLQSVTQWCLNLAGACPFLGERWRLQSKGQPRAPHKFGGGLIRPPLSLSFLPRGMPGEGQGGAVGSALSLPLHSSISVRQAWTRGIMSAKGGLDTVLLIQSPLKAAARWHPRRMRYFSEVAQWSAWNHAHQGRIHSSLLIQSNLKAETHLRPRRFQDTSGVAQWLACWAHNPKVRGLKPRSAILCNRLRQELLVRVYLAGGTP
jgi:hypothetical protein